MLDTNNEVDRICDWELDETTFVDVVYFEVDKVIVKVFEVDSMRSLVLELGDELEVVKDSVQNESDEWEISLDDVTANVLWVSSSEDLAEDMITVLESTVNEDETWLKVWEVKETTAVLVEYSEDIV